MPLGKFRALALLAVASAGLIGGHSLTYLRLSPSSGTRTMLLEASGHGYLETATVLASALALMAALFWLADGAIRTRHTQPSLGGTTVALAMIQVVGFVGQEILERVLAGASMQGLGSVVLIGLPVQVMVAVLGALVVTALHRAGKRIAVLLSRSGPAPAGSAPFSFAACVNFSSALLAGGLRTRGPPSLPSQA